MTINYTIDEIEKKILEDYKFQKQVEDGYFINHQEKINNLTEENDITINEFIYDNNYDNDNIPVYYINKTDIKDKEKTLSDGEYEKNDKIRTNLELKNS